MSQTYNLQLKITGDGDNAKVELDKVAKAADNVDNKSRKAGKGFNVLDDAVAKSKSNLKAWAVSAAAAAVALPTVVALNMARAALKNAEEVRRLTLSLNINAEALTQWQFASQTVGISGEKMADIFKDINDRVGDYATTGAGPLVDVMEQTNLQIKDLINLSPDQQLLKIYDALDQIDGITHAEKTFYLEALAGDASLLIPLLDDSAAKFEELALRADAFGITLSQLDVERLHIANQQFGIMGQQVEGIENQLAIGLAPAIFTVTKTINDAALANGGWGDIAATVADGMVDGLAGILDAIEQVNRGYLRAEQFANTLVIKTLQAAEVLGADNSDQIAKLMFKDIQLQTRIANSQLQSSGNVLRSNFKKNKAAFEAQAKAAIKLRNAQKPKSFPARKFGKDNAADNKRIAASAKRGARAVRKAHASQARAAKKAADEITRAEKRKADETARAAQRIRDAITSTNQQLDIQIIRLRQGDEAAERQILRNQQIEGEEQDKIIRKQAIVKSLEMQAAAQKKLDDDRLKVIEAEDKHNAEILKTYNLLTMLPDQYARWELSLEGINGKVAGNILAQRAANDAMRESQEQQKALAQSFEDDLLNSLKKGELNFSSFADHIISEALRLQAIKPLMDYLFGGVSTASGSRSGGAIGNIFGSLLGFHNGGTQGEHSFTREIPRFHSGIGPNEMPAVIEKTEGVFTKGQMSAMAPVMPIVNALSKNSTRIIIENKTGSNVEATNQRTDSNGDIRLDLVEKRMEGNIARNIRNGDGPILPALKQKLKVG